MMLPELTETGFERLNGSGIDRVSHAEVVRSVRSGVSHRVNNRASQAMRPFAPRKGRHDENGYGNNEGSFHKLTLFFFHFIHPS
jgi:hypothetical protein